MKSHSLCFLFIMLLTSISPINKITAQTSKPKIITTSFDKNNNLASFVLDSLEVLDQLAGTPEPEHYTAFWIWGDGNYRRDTTKVFNNSSFTSITSPQFTYTYPRKGTFTAHAYLLDRYSNDDPPELIAAPSEPIFTETKSLTTPVQTPIIPITDKIAIDTNHNARAEHNTVYVVSYLTKNAATQKAYGPGKVHFFYNCKKLNANDFKATPSAFTALPFIAHVPDYSKPTSLQRQTINSATTNNPELSKFFSDRIIYNYQEDEIASKDDLFKEARIFPVLYNSEKLIHGDVYRFLAVITSQDGAPINVNKPGWSGFLDQAGLTHAGNGIYLLDNQPIEDFVIIDQPVVRAHDPNNLYLEAVSYCKESGNYCLSYRLEFCNEGQAAAVEPWIKIFDEGDDDFSCFNFKTKEGKTNKPEILESSIKYTKGEKAELKTKAAFLKNWHDATTKEACGTLYFDAFTSDLGTSKITTSDIGMNLNIKMAAHVKFFEEDTGEVAIDSTLAWDVKMKFQDNGGPTSTDCACGEEESNSDTYSSWWMSLLAIPTTLGLYFGFIKKDRK